MNDSFAKPHWFSWNDRVLPGLLQHLEKLGGAARNIWHRFTATPGADVWETPDRYVVELDLPGIDPDQCGVTLAHRALVVCGKRIIPSRADHQRRLRTERNTGLFLREIQLPGPVDHLQVTARYRNGVMRIELPKAAKSLPHKVPIRTGAKASGT